MSSFSVPGTAGAGRIVVGVDGSRGSKEALRWAVAQARLTGQPVTAIMSWDYPVTYGANWDVPDWDEHCASVLKQSTDEILAGATDVQVTRRVARGHAAEVLLDAASDATLLVIGGRGHGGFRGLRLGSVSQHVVTHSSCPVVVVRGPDGQSRPASVPSVAEAEA